MITRELESSPGHSAKEMRHETGLTHTPSEIAPGTWLGTTLAFTQEISQANQGFLEHIFVPQNFPPLFSERILQSLRC